MKLYRYLIETRRYSRRKVSELIKAGSVLVNGRPVSDPHFDLNKEDCVYVGKERVALSQSTKLYLYHKPVGVVSTLSDEKGRPCVGDVIRKLGGGLFPVGRLDINTSGLLLLTNDGELANRLTHPRYGVWKEYRAKIRGVPTEETLRRFRKGIRLDVGMTKPAEIRIVRRTGSNSVVEIKIREGKYRQVRRMLEKLGHPVVKLTRVAVHSLRLGSISPGETKSLSPSRIAQLRDFEYRR